MPKVTITRSRTRLPASTGLSNIGPIRADTSVGEALSGVGTTLERLGAKRKQDMQIAEDSTYVANTGIRVQKEVEDIRKAHQEAFADSPKGYRDQLTKDTQKIYKQAIDAAPSPTARRTLEAQLGGFARADFSRADAWEQEARVVNFLSSHDESLNTLAQRLADNPIAVNKGEIAYQFDQLMQSADVYLDPKQRAVLEKKGLHTLSMSGLKGIADAEPETLKGILDSGEFDSIISVDEAEALLGRAERKTKSNEAEADKLETQVMNQTLDQMSLNLYRANTLDQLSDIEAEADAFLEKYPDATKSYISLMEKIDKRQADFTKQSNSIAYVDFALSKNTTLDYSNKDDKKAVDAYYEGVLVPSLGNAKDPMEAMVTFVSGIGVIPEALETSLKAGLSGGSPAMQSQSADTIAALAKRNPTLLNQLPNATVTRGQTIKYLRDSGLSTEEAVESANVQALEKGTAPYKHREAIFKEDKIEFDVSEFTKWSRNDPEMTNPQMETEWETLYKTLVVDQQVPFEVAEKEAIRRVEKSWGVTALTGGPRWEKYAPEAIYGVQGTDNTTWMKEDLTTTLYKEGLLDHLVSPEILDTIKADTLSGTDMEFLVNHLEKSGFDTLTGPAKGAALSAIKSKVRKTADTLRGLVELSGGPINMSEEDVAVLRDRYKRGIDSFERSFTKASPSQAIRDVSDKVTDSILEQSEEYFEDVVIKVNPNTVASKEPSYVLLKPNKAGMLEYIKDSNGVNIEWKPDFNQSRQRREIAEEDARNTIVARIEDDITREKRESRNARIKLRSNDNPKFNQNKAIDAGFDTLKSQSKKIKEEQ